MTEKTAKRIERDLKIKKIVDDEISPIHEIIVLLEEIKTLLEK